MSDARCVNLLTEKSLSEKMLVQGITESQFEPISSFDDALGSLRKGFSTPGYAMVIRVECVPIRTMVSIDGAIDKNSNVFSMIEHGRDSGGLVCGQLILLNLGSSSDHLADICGAFGAQFACIYCFLTSWF